MFDLYWLLVFLLVGVGACAGLSYIICVWLLVTDPAADLKLTIWRRK